MHEGNPGLEKLEGKTAVITGAASGIGLGMTEALAHRGMRVVMADVEADVLNQEAERLQKANYDVTACITDVSSIQGVEQLLVESIRDYGSVNVLCNNAGVSNTGGVPVWKSSQQDWDWVMGVNFQGVVNGIRVFIPHMLSHGQEAHIVNTSSILGLTTGRATV